MNFPINLPEESLGIAKELNIFSKDIEEFFTHGSGPGGQKINKTSLCVELTHKPTGVTVRVQKHRQQSANRLSAYKLLIHKIEEKVKGKESLKAKQIYKMRKQKMRRSKKSKEKMLENKHKKSEIKETRKSII